MTTTATTVIAMIIQGRLKIYPPEGYAENDLEWTMDHGQYLNHIDVDMYNFMSSGNQSQPGIDPRGISSIWMAVGSFDLNPGDTLSLGLLLFKELVKTMLRNLFKDSMVQLMDIRFLAHHLHQN